MLKVVIGALALLLAQPVDAQKLTRRPVSQGAVSPADMTKRLEQAAARTLASSPTGADRGAAFDFTWPADADEYRALAKHVLVLVSVVTQNAAELPLRRVYVSAGGHETELVRLTSQLSAVRPGSMTFRVLGPHREDGFYLAPAGAMLADGFLQADFATARNNFNLYKLPGTPPDPIKADSDPMPAPGATPEPAAVKAMLHREYKGFELPPGLR